MLMISGKQMQKKKNGDITIKIIHNTFYSCKQISLSGTYVLNFKVKKIIIKSNLGYLRFTPSPPQCRHYGLKVKRRGKKS